MMTEEKEQKLNKYLKKVNLWNGFRMIFLFAGVLLLLFLYFGPRFFEGAAWFIIAKAYVFRIAEWDVIFLVITTLIKTYFSIRYNQIVKSL